MSFLLAGKAGSDWLARWAAILLGFFVPISVAADNFLLAALLLFWLLAGNYREKIAAIRANPIALSALALYGMLVAGSFYGKAPFGEALDMLGKYVDLLFVPIFLTLFSDRETARRAMNAFLASMLLTLFLSYLIGFGILHQNSILRGMADNPVVFKLHITQNFFMAFAAFILALRAYQKRSAAYFVLALLCLYNVIFQVQGRIGFVVFVVLIAYFFIQKLGKKGVLAGIGASLLVGLAAYQFSPQFHDRIRLSAAEFSHWHEDRPAAKTDSIGQRMEFYFNTLAIIGDHPVLGSGTGSFSDVYAEKVKNTGRELTHNPHNEFLLIMVQTGIPGILLFLNLFYRQLAQAASYPPGRKELAAGLALSMIAGCLFNSFLMDHAEGLFFAWMSGLLFANNEV